MKYTRTVLLIFAAFIFIMSTAVIAQTTQEEYQQRIADLQARFTELRDEMQAASETGDHEGYNRANDEAQKIQEELKKLSEELTALSNLEARARRAYNDGLNALRRRDYQTALARANEAVELIPEYPRAFSVIGLANFHLRNFDESEKAYKRSIELDPEDPTVWENLGTLYDAMGRENDAISAFTRSIEIDSTRATVYYRKGNVYSSRLNDYLKAIPEFQKAVELNPNYHLAFNALGVAYKELNRMANARAAFESAVAVNETYGEAWIRLSDVYQELGKHDKAIEAAEKGIQHERRRALHAVAYIAKGKAFHMKGENAKAKEALEKAAENRSYAQYANWYIENRLNR